MSNERMQEKLEKYSREAYYLSNKINECRLEGVMPCSSDTVRLTEVSQMIYEIVESEVIVI